MRQFNERVVLQAIRLNGALSKADVARITRLSTQTASVIIDNLLRDKLVVKQARVRGRIGQPSVPIALNRDGAFTLGIKVGRRSLDVLALDFVGDIRYRESLEYAYPNPDTIFGAIAQQLNAVKSALGSHADRLVGVGVAAPLWLGGWREFLGAPKGAMNAWQGVDIRARIQSLTHLPVEFSKDTTAACVAELVMGQGRTLQHFLYLFIGTFVGGGIVIDSHLYPGPRGNAGAVGSVPLALEHATTPDQLLHKASGLSLEHKLRRLRAPAAAAHDERALSPRLRPATDEWLAEACPALALTITSATALLDIDAVVIDGSMHRGLVENIVHQTGQVLDNYNWEGLHRPRLITGSIGANARALGGALLPLHSHFAPNREHFLKPESAVASR